MTKQDIIEYVMETPGNTNKAVLTSMLNSLVADDIPIEERTYVLVVDDTAITYDDNGRNTFDFPGSLYNSSSIKVTINDQTYFCNKYNIANFPIDYYGATVNLGENATIDFSQYPFLVCNDSFNNTGAVMFPEAGSYDIQISVLADSINNGKEEVELVALENGLYIPDEGTVYSSVTVDVSNDSGFSVVTIDFYNNTDIVYYVYAATPINNAGQLGSGMDNCTVISALGRGSVTVALYQGQAFCRLVPQSEGNLGVTVDGDITLISEGLYSITGNGNFYIENLDETIN